MSSITPAQASRQEHRDQQGRYAEYEHSEPEMNLPMQQDDITQRGSFYFPPRFTSSEDTVDFYSRIEIDDEVIARAVIASHQHREAIMDQLEQRKRESIEIRLQEYLAEWDRQPENNRKRKSPERAEAEQAERDRLNELPHSEFGLDDPPPSFGTQDGSEIVRAIKMCQYRPSPARFPEESQKVEDHVVTLDDEDLTVRQIMDRYATDPVKEQLVYQPKQVEDQHGNLLELIEGLRGELAEVRRENQAILQNNQLLAKGIDQTRSEIDDRFKIQEAALGYCDSRGNIIGPGRRAARKMMGRD